MLAAAFFALFSAVQLNDPDPWLWVAVSGGASAICVASILGRLPWAIPLLVCVLCGAGATWLGVLGIEESHLMPGFPQSGWLREERVREGLGLCLVGGWMGLLAWTGARRVRLGSD